jgi:hypothetical protein
MIKKAIDLKTKTRIDKLRDEHEYRREEEMIVYKIKSTKKAEGSKTEATYTEIQVYMEEWQEEKIIAKIVSGAGVTLGIRKL